MKFKTFRALVVLGAVLLGAGGFYLFSQLDLGSSPDEPATIRPIPPDPDPGRAELAERPDVVESRVRQPERDQQRLPTNDDPNALRPVDQQVLRLIRQGISGDKVKDAVKSGPYKVNLYRDAGHATVNRVKIDYDRDEKWDEKWDVAGPSEVVRKLAPNDDEQYTRELVLQGDRWAEPGAPAPATSAPAPTEAATADPADASTRPGDALRPWDEKILALVERGISGDKVKDALKGERVKVNLYKDAGKPGVNRLKIDLDRDEKWDEKWDFDEPGSRAKVKRHVAPQDDERYTDEYRLREGRWVRK